MRREGTWRGPLALGLLLALGACGEEKMVEDGGMDAGFDDGGADASPDASPEPDGGADAMPDAQADAEADAGPMGTCGPQGWGESCGPRSRALLTASVFGDAPKAWIGLVNLSTGTVSWSDPITDDTDLTATLVGCTPVVLRRATGEIALQDPAMPLSTVRTLRPTPMGVDPSMWGYNPWAIAASGPFTGVVAPYAVNELTLVDASCDGAMARLGSVDLSGFMVDADMDGMADDPDGSVDAADVVVHEGRAYVALARNAFDSTSFSLQYFGGATIAVVDLATGELVDQDPSADGVQGIDIGYENPVEGLFVAEVGGSTKLYVGAIGDHFGADGAVVVVDLATGTVEGTVFQETTEQILLDMVVDDATDTLFALVQPELTDGPNSTALVRVNLATGESTQLVGSTRASLLAVAGDTLLMLEGTQLRTFSTADGSETTPEAGIDLSAPEPGAYYASLVAIP